MIARNAERLAQLENTVASTKGFVCDVESSEALIDTLNSITDEFGTPNVIIHNAVGGTFGNFLEVSSETLERNFRINTVALLYIAQQLLPKMMERGEGALICTGNTSAYRGKALFSAFAPTKAAQRILLESIARQAGPSGIHAAFVAIDAVIDLPWTRERFPEKPDEFFCQPDDIAEECYRIAHQPKSAWSSETIIRPYCETW